MGERLPFTGRGQELERLREALAAAAAGRGQLWLVSGEPGIGKSRLVEELVTHAGEQARVLSGWAWEAGGAPAFWPWIQVLRQLCEQLDDAALGGLLGTRASWLGQLLPELAKRLAGQPVPPPLEPEQARFQLMDAAASLLRDAARERPLLVILEDLHAADASSVLLLDFLGRQLRTAALMVVGTYREAEAQHGPLGQLLARVHRQPQSLSLPRLDERAVAELLGGVLGLAPEASVSSAVYRSSEGNPLFVAEAARLVRTGGDVRAVPDGVRGAIRARLAGLAEPTREALAVASVLGRDFALDEVALLCDRPSAELADELRPAVEAAVIGPERGACYRFTHFCIREVIHDDLPEARRWALHRRLAAALQARLTCPSPPAFSELAHHLLEAGPEARSAALDALEQAAEHALSQLAFDEAATAYRAALEAAPADTSATRRVTSLIGLGRALTFAGDVAAGRGAFERGLGLARASGDRGLFAQAALALGSDLVFAEVDASLVAALEEALVRLGPSPSPLRAEVMARLSAALQPAPDPQVAIAMAREAIAMARAVGDRKTLLSALRNGCSAMMDLVDAAERLPLNAEMARLADELDSPLDALRAAQRLAFDHIELGDRASVVTALDKCQALASVLAHPLYRARSCALAALLAIHDGRFELAEAQLDEARRLSARTSDRNAPRTALLQRHGMARLRGDRTTMRSCVLELEAHWLPGFMTMMSHVLVAEAFADSDPALARSRLEAVDVPLLLRVGDASLIEPLVYAIERLGDGRWHELIVEALQPRVDRFVSWGSFGMLWGPPVRYLAGLLERLRGRHEAALELLALAEKQCHAVGSAPHALRCAEQRALALAAAGRRAEADALGAELARRAAALGLPALALPDAGHDHEPVGPRLGGAPAPGAPAAVTPQRPSVESLSAQREGETWWIQHAGRGFRLRDTKGVRLLARLLEEPGREFHVLDLAGASDTLPAGSLPLLDDAARAAYQRRVEHLREELDEAERFCDAGRRERASAELEQLGAELARATGLGGRKRSSGDPAERARVNIQRRLRDAIERIRELDAPLAKHLDWAVRTGTFCSYDPS